MMKVTGWINADVITWVSCPKCGVEKGQDCISKAHAFYGRVHIHRVGKYKAEYPDREELYFSTGLKDNRSQRIKEYNAKLEKLEKALTNIS